MIDWNGDGRHDLEDDMIGLAAYSEDERSEDDGAGDEAWAWWMLLACAVVAALAILIHGL